MKNPHTPNLTSICSNEHKYLVHNCLEPGQFTLISMGPISYSCGHISGPMNRFPPNLGCGCFSSCSTNTWYPKRWNTKKKKRRRKKAEIQKKKKKEERKEIWDVIASVLYKLQGCKFSGNCLKSDLCMFSGFFLQVSLHPWSLLYKL